MKKVPEFGVESFSKKLLEKKKLWPSLEPLIITKLPSFEEEMDYILSFM